jgi:hypothetical protein
VQGWIGTFPPQNLSDGEEIVGGPPETVVKKSVPLSYDDSKSDCILVSSRPVHLLNSGEVDEKPRHGQLFASGANCHGLEHFSEKLIPLQKCPGIMLSRRIILAIFPRETRFIKVNDAAYRPSLNHSHRPSFLKGYEKRIEVSEIS